MVDRVEHLPVNTLPIMVEIDRPRLDAEALKTAIGPEGFVHLRVQQNALVLRPQGSCGFPVPQICEELVQVGGVQLTDVGPTPG